MSDQEIGVKGLAELQKFLDTLPAKLQKNIMRGALRAGLKPMQDAARAHVHNVSGKLAAGLRIGTRVRGAEVVANLATKGEHGSIAHLVEFGTAAHLITPIKAEALSFWDRVVTSVLHPGAQPKPFMRPAFDSQATAAVVETGRYVQGRLTKEGLDVAGVQVEGDA